MRKFLIMAGVLISGAAIPSAALADDFWVASDEAMGAGKMGIVLDLSNFNMAPGGRTHIVLPDGTKITATLKRVENHTLGGHSWVGTTGTGDKAGRILLTEVSGFSFGEIIYDNQQYMIEPREGRSGHIIYRADDPSRIELELENDGVVPPFLSLPDFGAKDKAAKGGTGTPVSGSKGAIDVGIFYHDSMIDRWGLGLAARLQFLVSLYDTALLDSLTDVRANLVHVEKRTGTIGGKSNSDTLSDLKDNLSNPDGDFSGIEAIRTAKGIDVVTYIRRFKKTAHISCGNGFVLGGAASGTLVGGKAFSYNVVSDDKDIDAVGGSFSFCTTLTLAHEIGHNMGTNHDTATTPGDGVFSFSHGYRVDGKFRTIMGTSTAAGEKRLSFYSNPDIIECKKPASADAKEACGLVGSNAAKSIRDAGNEMKDFRASAARVVSSILPSSRAIGDASGVGTATAFATVINPSGSGLATGCGLAWPGASAAQFSYQTTNALNVPVGTKDTPVDILAGKAQNFVFSIKPGGEFTSAHVPIDFFCSNRASAEITDGLNTLLFSAVDGTTPDVVALAATIGSTGIVETDPGGAGAFSVAVSNVGASGTITMSAETSSAGIPATLSVCETVPATGACKVSPSSSVDVVIPKDGTATFGVFVTETATIVADLANTRVNVFFKESGAVKGATSVAVKTKTP